MHDLFLCLQSKMCNLYSFRKRINVLFIFVIRFYRCTYFAMNVIQMVQIADILGFMRSSFSCGRPLNSLEMIENITKNNQAAKSYRAYVMCLWWKGQVELNTKHFSILNLLLNTLGLYWNLTSFLTEILSTCMTCAIYQVAFWYHFKYVNSNTGISTVLDDQRNTALNNNIS